MTDGDKKVPPEEEQLDWDKALSEWDDQSFAPEVAKDVVTDKRAALAGASRPLYRPPPLPASTPTTAKPRPPPPLPRTRSPEPPAYLDDDGDSATKIAILPPDVRARSASLRTTRGGGLGQLFAREERREVAVDVSFEEKAKTPAAEPMSSAEAQAFDPFADLGPPRSAQATRPAENELEELLAAAPPSSLPVVEPEPAAPTRRGDSLLAPQARLYDPDEETVIGQISDRAALKAALQGSIERQRAAKGAVEPAPLPVSEAKPEPVQPRVWRTCVWRTRLRRTRVWRTRLRRTRRGRGAARAGRARRGVRRKHLGRRTSGQRMADGGGA